MRGLPPPTWALVLLPLLENGLYDVDLYDVLFIVMILNCFCIIITVSFYRKIIKKM